MYKVLLVDDEAMARTGLYHFFDWEGNGYKIVGEASNGQKAMQWVENQEVDILITDISMPVMDGLELTRWTRKVSPRTKIILLSSYNDFEYAREGMRLGASDYLLKPTLENENLIQVLEKVRRQVVEEREKQGAISSRDKHSAAERTLLKWLSGEYPPGGSIEWLAEGCRICVCSLDNKQQMKKGGAYMEFIMEEALDIGCKLHEKNVAVRGAFDHLVLLLPDKSQQIAADSFKRIRHAFQAMGVSFTMGVSMPISQPFQVPDAYEQAVEAVELRFFQGLGDMYSYSPILELRSLQASGNFKTLRELFKKHICDGFRHKSGHCLQEITDQWEYEHKTAAEVHREAQDILCLLHALNPESLEPVDRLSSLRNLETVEEVKEWTLAVFSDFWCDRKLSEPAEAGSVHQHVVARAIAYIQSNYAVAVSLQDVARQVSMSKNYFSEVFKKVTGQNFVEYVIQLRLNRAKELLQDPMIKVYEVAEMAGFSDVKYFSKLFKKFMQISPTDYREKFLQNLE